VQLEKEQSTVDSPWTDQSVPRDTLRSIEQPKPKIAGLYENAEIPSIAIKVRYSDNESEVDFTSAAVVMREHGRLDLALQFARKSLLRNPKDLVPKLLILEQDPMAAVGDLTPHTPQEAANFALWLTFAKKTPIEGLKVTSSWLQRFPEDKQLAGANFLCAFTVYGADLFAFLLGKENSTTSLP